MADAAQREDAGATPHVWFAYRQPAPDLRDFVSGYHFVEIDSGGLPVEDFNYPAWTLLRFTLGGAPWQARVGGSDTEVPSAALFGVSSSAAHIRTSGGLMVGAGVTPLGWAQLFGGDASEYADRCVPLEAVIGDDAARLRSRLRRETGEDGWAAVFDDWFAARLAAAPPLPRDVAAIHRMLLDPEIYSVEQIAGTLALTPRHVGRIALKVFGLAPKLLIRRARFLRAAMPLRQHDPRPLPDRVRVDYPDYALFARDCRAFLGLSPSAFVASARPISDTSTAERTRRLGAPAQGLHAPG